MEESEVQEEYSAMEVSKYSSANNLAGENPTGEMTKKTLLVQKIIQNDQVTGWGGSSQMQNSMEFGAYVLIPIH
jgi:hypothetical protein